MLWAVYFFTPNTGIRLEGQLAPNLAAPIDHVETEGIIIFFIGHQGHDLSYVSIDILPPRLFFLAFYDRKIPLVPPGLSIMNDYVRPDSLYRAVDLRSLS